MPCISVFQWLEWKWMAKHIWQFSLQSWVRLTNKLKCEILFHTLIDVRKGKTLRTPFLLWPLQPPMQSLGVNKVGCYKETFVTMQISLVLTRSKLPQSKYQLPVCTTGLCRCRYTRGWLKLGCLLLSILQDSFLEYSAVLSLIPVF